MDTEDHRKNNLSGHDSHGVHVCHKCGWPFPNPHPSAKHRRAHKKICGTVERYKLIDLEEQSRSTLSDDEQLSDEDRQTPSPKLDNRSIKEISSGGVGERSNRSEDEVFSDAVAKFSDSGFSPAPGFEEHLEGVRELGKNVENIVEGNRGTRQLFKVDATADTMHPPDNPANTSNVHNPEVLERAPSQLGSSTPVQDIGSSYTIHSMEHSASDTRTVELAVGLNGTNGSIRDLPPIKSETPMAAPEEDINASVGDIGMHCSMICHGQETDVKANEENNVDKVLSDDIIVPDCKTANKASDESKLPEMDGKTSDTLTADGIKSKKGQSELLGPKMSKHDIISPEVESAEHMEAFVSSVRVNADFSQDIDVDSHDGFNQVCDTKGEGSVDMHVLSVANDLPVVDHPEIMIADFKDHKAPKSNLPLSLGSDEVIRLVEDDAEDTVYEERHSNAYLSKPGENVNTSSARGNKCIVQEVTVEREADGSEFKAMSGENVGFSSIEVPLGTIMTESKEVQTNQCCEGLQPHDFDSDLAHNISSEYNTRDLSYVIPTVTYVVVKVDHTTDLSGGDDTDDHKLDKIEKFDEDTNDSGEGAVEEKISANRETPPESADNLCVQKVDEITNLLGLDGTGDHKMVGVQFSDVAGNESTEAAGEEKNEMNTKTTMESACHLSESQVAADDGMDKVERNLQESESTYFDGVSNSSKDGICTCDLVNMTQTHSNSQNCQDEDNSEALAEYVVAVSMDAKSNDNGDVEVVQKSSENFNLKDQEPLPVESVFTIKNSANVEDSHRRDNDEAVSGVSSELLQEEGDENLAGHHANTSAVDMSIDSSGRIDSLEGHWGSVSVLSNQSCVAAVDAEALPSTHSQGAEQSEKTNLEKTRTASEQHHSDRSDVFEAPSFMTLVESGGGVDQKAASSQQPKSEALKVGWFPSLTNVVNESQGRKKNEEMIAKVTNWSTGKQHIPLKSLLGEANLQTKPKSPSPKHSATVVQKDETTANNTGASAMTVDSILGPDEAASRDAGKEWNSPARYPTDKNKKDKRKIKGKPYWIPFVCCYSVN